MTRRDITAHRATRKDDPRKYGVRFAKERLRRKFQVLGRVAVSPVGILCCGAILWLGTVSIGVAMLMAARVDAFDRAVQNSRNLTLVLERDIQRSVDLYDLSLRAVAEGTVDGQVMALPPRLRDRVLFDRAATARYLGSIVVKTEDGKLLADSDGSSADLNDRVNSYPILADYQMASGGLYIGRPVSSSSGGGPMAIPLGRAIYNPDGKIMGRVVGSLSLEYFRALTNGLSVGKNGSVAVFEADGTLISRLPYTPGNIGRNFAHAPVFQRLIHEPEGFFVATARLDGVRRLYVYKRLSGLPLIVTVAPAMSTVYAEWRARAEWFGVLIFIFTAIKAAGTWLFVRELRRRQRAEAELERVAHRDSLTGLENRATFDEVLEREWRRARRNDKPLSLLFIDIDKFKAYNDCYGHQAGDAALKAVAKRISACLVKPGDHVARYGGEEFVVVLPDTHIAGAMLAAEKIRQAVVDLRVEHSKTSFGCVTVSVGVSSTDVPTISDAGTLVRTADAALYEAKNLGRNRVSVVQSQDAALLS